MMYRAEFSDDSVLTFEASKLKDALSTVAAHAYYGDEFTLQSRRSERTPWGSIRPSCWEVNYPDKKTECKRVR